MGQGLLAGPPEGLTDVASAAAAAHADAAVGEGRVHVLHRPGLNLSCDGVVCLLALPGLDLLLNAVAQNVLCVLMRTVGAAATTEWASLSFVRSFLAAAVLTRTQGWLIVPKACTYSLNG